MGDVKHAPKSSRKGTTTKQVKSGIIEGPTASPENLVSFNRKK